MSDAIIVAIITGGISLFGSILTIMATSRKQTTEMDKKIAIIETKMDDIKEDVRAHNKYAQMFSENIPAIRQHMVDVDRRLDNMERRGA